MEYMENIQNRKQLKLGKCLRKNDTEIYNHLACIISWCSPQCLRLGENEGPQEEPALREFAAILDAIEDESDEMYAFSRFLKNKSVIGRTALEKKDYEKMLRILDELDTFMKSIGL